MVSTPVNGPNATARPQTASDGVHWHIAAGHETAVTGDSAPNWFALADDPRAERVKRNPVREVYRTRLSCGVFFAKVFTHANLAATIKRWFVGPPAGREFHVAQALVRAKVGAIRVVAAGVAPSGDRSVLISEEFSGAQTLAELWERRAPRSARLIECVAAFLGRTHDADILPRDTHPDNLLLHPGATAGEWAIVYADLAGTRIGRPVTKQEAARHITELLQWFRSRSTATQRARFLRAYARERFGADRGVRRRFARLVEASAVVHQHRLWAKRDRRILGTNVYFARADLGGGCTAHFVLRCRRDPHGLAPFRGERTPAEWRQWTSRHLPDLTGSPPAALPDNLYLERDRAGRWQGLWRRLAGSPLRRFFVVAHTLRHRDLPALHVPILFEHKSSGGAAQSALIIHRPAGCTSLHGAVQTLPGDRRRGRENGNDHRARRHLLGETARLLADMAQRGVTARRLTPDSFAVAPGAASNRPVVYIADFRGLTVRRRPAFGTVAWLPACLWGVCPRGVTRTDCLRFLLAYRRRLPGGLRGRGWKALWRRVEAHLEPALRPVN